MELIECIEVACENLRQLPKLENIEEFAKLSLIQYLSTVQELLDGTYRKDT